MVAGIGLLVMAMLAGLANFAAIEPLVTDGDATRTTRDVLASQHLVRLAIAALVAGLFCMSDGDRRSAS